MTQVDIEQERQERLKLWKGRYSEPLEVVPEPIRDVTPGRICRLWFMPNQSRFVVLGLDGDRVRVALHDGHVSGFTPECLIVPIDAAPANFPDLLGLINDVEKHIGKAAWAGRMAE